MPELYDSIARLDGGYWLFLRSDNTWPLPSYLPNMVYADSLVLFPFASYSAFCILQSRAHELWAKSLGSSMKDDLRYTPSDCFETFRIP